ncbi:hypothetical protein U6B65_14650 [Oscillospiraceae bacterium MB08-C2-2]|nr:hypothetical protein U6B65_14650 [Oscillospiraceae bacterium MB08-C2-2]
MEAAIQIHSPKAKIVSIPVVDGDEE